MPDDSESLPPRRLEDPEELREIAAASLVHHFAVPWLLVPAFSSGLFLTGHFSTNVQPIARERQILEWCLGGMGVLGTMTTILIVRHLRRRPANWWLLHLGRTSWILWFTLVWLAGACCGVFILGG